MIGFDEYTDWFRLLETPGIGRETARRLLAALGSPAAVLGADAATLRELVGARAAGALARRPDGLDARLQAARAWWQGGPDRAVIALGDDGYPPALLETADPPLLLYVAGDRSALAADALAIVGSRRATPQGLANARHFARVIGDAGTVIVSGLALGIDAAAHEGALDGAGRTVAVVGCGLDEVYPRRHQALAARIERRGALVSEYAPGTPALAEHFPQRNRIIAGLAQGTLVVEAALQSGSLITARLAGECGREVYALPGSIHAEQSRGCHALLRQGAQLVETPQDILDDLAAVWRRPQAPARAATPGPRPVEDALLRALGTDMLTLDELIDRTGWPVGDLQARMLEHELEGRIARLPGGRYQRIHRA